jgi:dTDP-glucose 4,6-dehydratase
VTTILITGGAGFIGSNLVRYILDSTPWSVVVLDALTYAGNLQNLVGLEATGRLSFVHGSINDEARVASVLQSFKPDAIINCAAETHVDRSIASALPFVETNVCGTTTLLGQVRSYGAVKVVQVSTDEVYGSLAISDRPFTASHPLRPSSAYAASKAAADLMVLADVHTHGTNAVITRCTNNYGPFQFPEKLVPLMTLNAIEGRHLPVYGNGSNVRDWIHVLDHCRGLLAALDHGTRGAVYAFGGQCEHTNLDVVHRIVNLLGADPALIEFVRDRPGHDLRYAVDNAEATSQLGWSPRVGFDDGLAQTVEWYKQNLDWAAAIRDGSYRRYYQEHYGRSLH